MAHTFTQSGNNYTFQVGTIQLRMVMGGANPEHDQVINALNHPVTGEAARLRMEELLTWNHNYAFVIFCSENGIIIPPAQETPTDV